MATAIPTAADRSKPAQILNGLAWAVALVAAAVAALIVTAVNVADWGVRTANAPVVALASAYSPAAAETLAEGFQLSGRSAEAEALARKSLASAPLSARALRVFGFSRQVQGDVQQGAAAMALAGALGWRDTPTQLWLAEAYLGQGDVPAAIERADALARRRQLEGEMMAFFMSLAVDPKSRDPLIERLTAMPPWRERFFYAARSLQVDEAPAFAEFLARLSAKGAHLPPAEVAPFVDGLFEAGEYGLAHRVWRRFGKGSATVTDPGFSQTSIAQPGVGPFRWDLLSSAGMEADIAEPSFEAGGRALLVRSVGQTRADVARQALALAPGRYRLSIEAAPDEASPAALSALAVALGCPNAPPLPLSERPRSQSGHWTRLSWDLSVPASGCRAQFLTLTLRGMQSGPVGLWLDNIEVAPARAAG